MNASDNSQEGVEPTAAQATPTGDGGPVGANAGHPHWPVIGLFVLAVFYTLYFTADFTIPVTGALLLKLIFSPATSALKRLGIPYFMSAAIIVLALVAALVGGFYSLSDPVTEWISRIPVALERVEEKAREIMKPIEDVQRASERVGDITKPDSQTRGPTLVVQDTDLVTRLFGSLTNMVVEMGLMLILLYFLLAVGDLFQQKLVRIVPRLKDKMRAQSIASRIVHEISIYLATITLINAILGTIIGMGLYMTGLPNALMWGVMAGLLNFVPYLGALVGISIVGIASFMAFDTISHAILPPIIYGAINTLEGQFITPSVVSRRLTLNPAVVFLAVSFGAWFWGIPGALMAVPLLVVVKILSDQIDSLHPLAELIGGPVKKIPSLNHEDEAPSGPTSS